MKPFALVLMAVPPTTAEPQSPASGYTVTDSIGRNPDDVCMLAYHSGHWSDWLAQDAAGHHVSRTSRRSMLHYCDGFIHGMKFKGQ